MPDNDNKSNVITLNIAKRLDAPPERVLKYASESDLESIVIIGYNKDGSEYFASSIADGTEVLWLMERFKKRLLEIGDE